MRDMPQKNQVFYTTNTMHGLLTVKQTVSKSSTQPTKAFRIAWEAMHKTEEPDLVVKHSHHTVVQNEESFRQPPQL